MKNRLLLNGLLLFTLGGLVALLWLKPRIEDKQISTISQLSKDEINKITIQRINQEKIHLEKNANTWKMISPHHTAINHNKIQLLLTLLNEPIRSEYPALGKDLKQFDLEPEKTSIQFNNENKIVFGMSNPVSHDRYLLQNENILLLSETVYGTLTSNISSFFTTQLVPKNTKINTIELPDSYKLKAGTAAKWKNVSAVQVLSWNSDEQSSQGSIKLTLDNGKKLIYQIISTEPELMLGNTALKAKYQIMEENAKELLPK